MRIVFFIMHIDIVDLHFTIQREQLPNQLATLFLINFLLILVTESIFILINKNSYMNVFNLGILANRFFFCGKRTVLVHYLY